MKKILLLAALALSLGSSFRADAQVRVNINIGAPVAQQPWYGSDDDYYYMPDQDVYYNTRRRVYVYSEGGRWVYAPSLPQRYGNYSYSNARYYQVREHAPFERNDYYRRRYQVSNNNYRHDNGSHRGWDNHTNGNGPRGGYDHGRR